MRWMGRYLGSALLVLAILTALFVLFLPYFGWRMDIILSDSMSPALRIGSLALTRPVRVGEIKVGDIITYGSPINGELVTHRVMEIKRSERLLIRTKGDANEDRDPYLVPPQNIVGRVCFRVPVAGYVAYFLKTPLGFTLALLLPGLALVAMEVRDIYRAWLAQQQGRKSGLEVEGMEIAANWDDELRAVPR